METGLRAELPVLDEAVDEHISKEELIERFATIQNISKEQAAEMVGAESEEEVLKNIQDFTVNKIKENSVKLNRKQRRALEKKYGKGAALHITTPDEQNVINETAKKLNYIDLIQKLRKLNEEKEKENGETTIEDN